MLWCIAVIFKNYLELLIALDSVHNAFFRLKPQNIINGQENIHLRQISVKWLIYKFLKYSETKINLRPVSLRDTSYLRFSTST